MSGHEQQVGSGGNGAKQHHLNWLETRGARRGVSKETERGRMTWRVTKICAKFRGYVGGGDGRWWDPTIVDKGSESGTWQCLDIYQEHVCVLDRPKGQMRSFSLHFVLVRIVCLWRTLKENNVPKHMEWYWKRERDLWKFAYFMRHSCEPRHFLETSNPCARRQEQARGGGR